MRLINTTTYKFEDFFDRPIPQYAILSHRWDEREASYQSYKCCQNTDGPGMRKVVDFCKFAKAHRPAYDYIWVDTCCINKRNNAELSESINSMYQWYQNSQTCFVYLRDLPPKDIAHKKERNNAFRKSEWFRRGWTLQELLAPSRVIFCDREWKVYGGKVRLSQEIAEITGIAEPFLKGTHALHQASVAMRMSWASDRQTTKPEDKAYCLLGLFDVHMPLLYGEKHKAFMRLQEELLKRSDDESIFAWTADCPQWGMLAPSPEAFRDSSNVVDFRLHPEQRMPYEMTNKGLRFRSASDTYAKDDADFSTAEPMGYPSHVAELGCFFGKEKGMINEHPDASKMWENSPITIELQRFGPTWLRIKCGTLGRGHNRARRKRRNGTFFGRSVQRTYIVNQPARLRPGGTLV